MWFLDSETVKTVINSTEIEFPIAYFTNTALDRVRRIAENLTSYCIETSNTIDSKAQPKVACDPILKGL
ncbi:MAG: hypothetical protein HC780_05810 [Leptolyngbyaceae cyanobacterium CSU_1_3]|nr:hypothetical protein [Leptolyngbyaceae cyanobacterium CSU_1_3]